ncbi:MAG: DDE-type integrase/transposase/recombinase [Candidatus Kariarchaeaceae archaeon]|jgi:transposase InsO family protein
MSKAGHVTLILHNEEVGPAEVELLMSKLKQVLVKKAQVRAFISLVQTIEDRSDPQSKYYDKTIDQILESFGVARATYYRKSKNYREFGLDGIIPKKPGPKSSRLTSQILSRIFELRNRQLSSRTIASAISLEGQKYLPESTTQYQLRKVGKGKLKRNRKKKVYYKRFERGKPNELWQIDNVGPFYKPGKLFAYNVIDDHSRYNLAAVISDNQTSDSWAETLENLVAKHGVPEAILHDNGSQFVDPKTSILTKNFDRFLKKYGIRSIRSRLRHPQTTGKVERVQQSMQYEARDLVFTDTIAELQEAVDNWRDFYNKVRNHSSTKMTPHARYFGQEVEYAAKLSAWQHYEHSLIKFDWR